MLACCLFALGAIAADPVIRTVTGDVPASELGHVLVHEHVLVDFAGAAVANPDRYDRAEVMAVMLPHLKAARAAGVGAIFECTPRHLGRDPELLVQLSDASGVRLVTNTGLYLGKYLPEWALTATVDELAENWVAEARDGLDGTTVRPGFIKIAVDGPPISEVQQRIVRAAARTSLATGLAVVMHCPRGASAVQAIELVTAEGLAPSRLIVAHADSEQDARWHEAIASAGAWLSFDGVREGKAEERLPRVLDAYRRWPDRLLLSQDAGWYRVGEPGGGQQTPLDWLPRAFLPALTAAGWQAVDIDRVMRLNPAAALGLRPSEQPTQGQPTQTGLDQAI